VVRTTFRLFNQMVDEGAERALASSTRRLRSVKQMDDERLSRVFGALADPTRRDLVARLAVADATLTELASSYDVSVQAVSKHLKVLEDAGLVRRTKEAQRRPCHLDAEVLDLMTGWIERRRREVEERYQRLDAVLDRMAAQEQPQEVRHRREGEAS
jgi:DNA-binding transcriptional ArsR family regulator